MTSKLSGEKSEGRKGDTHDYQVLLLCNLRLFQHCFSLYTSLLYLCIYLEATFDLLLPLVHPQNMIIITQDAE
jgi:hypothetical protein